MKHVLALLLAASFACPAAEPVWQLVPLRMAEQKARGFKGGEMGQMAFTLAICAHDPNLMAMGIDTAAVYVSEDGGRNWELRRRGIKSNGVQSIAFDPVNKNMLWAAGLASKAGTKRAFPPSPRYYDKKADGIYRSDDLGRSWTLVRNAAFLRSHAQNAYFAFDPSAALAQGCASVYALTHDAGLLKTEDGGNTWAAIGPKGIIGHAIVRHANTGRLWLAADQGVWRSDDNGATWAEIKPPAAPVLGLALRPDHHDVVYVALGRAGVWRTVDAGHTWQRWGNGLPQNITWVQLVVSPANPDVMYVDATRWGGRVPYYSHDAGKTWHPMERREPGFYGAGIYWAEGLAVHPSEPVVAFHLHPPRVTADGGKTWQLIGSGVSGSRRATRTAIAFRPDDPNKMAFFYIDHGLSLTEDGGDTWAYLPAPRQSDLGARTMPCGAYDARPGSRTIVSAVGGWSKQRLCITHDDGRTWKVWPDMVDNYRFFGWHPQDPKVVYIGAAKSGMRSDDAGKTWKKITRPIRAMLRSNGDVIYAVTKPAKRRWRVERSTDRGETWRALGEDVPYSVSDIDVDPENPDRVYAATAYAGVWVFDGREWSARGEAHGLEKDFFGSMIFRSVTVDPRQPNVVYAGQNHCWRGIARGIFRSTDYGKTWRNINGNLGPDLTVWSVTVSPHDSTVWLGTDYGNWRLPGPSAH